MIAAQTNRVASTMPGDLFSPENTGRAKRSALAPGGGNGNGMLSGNTGWWPRGEWMFSTTQAKTGPAFAGRYKVIDFSLSNCINSHINKVAVLTDYQQKLIIKVG